MIILFEIAKPLRLKPKLETPSFGWRLIWLYFSLAVWPPLNINMMRRAFIRDAFEKRGIPYEETHVNWSHDTDPYGHMTWCIGSEDDFWCLDFATDEETLQFRLHAVINSETGHFIQNAEEPTVCALEDAADHAQRLVDEAVEWCVENGVEIDSEGWATEKQDFVESVRREAKRMAGGARA